MSIADKKIVILSKKQFLWRKFFACVFISIAIILGIIGYIKWYSMNPIGKALMTITEFFLLGFSFGDIKDQFKSYERYKKEKEQEIEKAAK